MCVCARAPTSHAYRRGIDAAYEIKQPYLSRINLALGRDKKDITAAGNVMEETVNSKGLRK